MKNPFQNRRDFLATGLRTALVAGLGWIALTLGRRPAACGRPSACRDCAVFADCARPEKEVRP